MSLSLKILIPIVISTAVVIFLFTFYLIDNRRTQSEAQLYAKAEKLTDLLAYANINTLWNYDIDELKNISQSFFQDQDITLILIKDHKGTTYENLTKKIKTSKPIILKRSIEKDGEILGELTTEFTNFYIEKNLAGIRNKLILLCLTLFCVLTLIVVLVSKQVLKPLSGVLTGIDHISKGDYSYRIESRTNDEIGRLSKQFNDMSQQIRILQNSAVKAAEQGKEMEIAKNIQLSLQPCLDGFTKCGFEISANMTPAEDVGGDYYDIIVSPDHKLWFGIGDVTGHGLVAGLVMMMAQVSINTLIRSVSGLTPEQVLIYTNKVLQSNIREGLKKDHHMTINFIKEEKPGVYRYAGAHEILLIYRSSTGQIEQIPTKGMWLGIIDDISGPIQKYAGSFTLEKDDIVFLYTDGVIEIKNKNNEQYDIHNLTRFLKQHADRSTKEIKLALLSELNRFKDRQLDDITFLIMRKE